MANGMVLMEVNAIWCIADENCTSFVSDGRYGMKNGWRKMMCVKPTSIGRIIIAFVNPTAQALIGPVRDGRHFHQGFGSPADESSW
jgi:hypothetical protein